MPLLVAADTHPGLEVASWIVAIVAFGLVILQLFFYWFGRQDPLQVRATGWITPTAERRQVLRLSVEFRSRTRDTQTVRELVLFEPPNALSRMLRPWWYKTEIPVIPAVPPPPPLPKTIDGHDTAEVTAAFDSAGFTSRTRLKVRASRRRPHVARIHMKTEASPPPPAISQAAEVPVAPPTGEPSADPGEKEPGEQDPATSNIHRQRVSARTLADRIGRTVQRHESAAAPLPC